MTSRSEELLGQLKRALEVEARTNGKPRVVILSVSSTGHVEDYDGEPPYIGDIERLMKPERPRRPPGGF